MVANVNVDNENNAKTGNIILTKSRLSKKVVGKNNNNIVVTQNIKNIDMVNSKQKAEINRKNERSRSKIVPIIQTRKMKQRSKEQSELQKEIKFLSKIDNLSSSEIKAGNEIDHDGVEISINGSDIEDFPEEQQQQTSSCQTEVAETTESTQDANENPKDSNENMSMTEP